MFPPEGGGRVGKGKRLKEYKLSVIGHGDRKYRIGKRVNNIAINYVWWQMVIRLIVVLTL